MNKLDQEIEKASEEAGLNTSFKRGAQFILDKNLAVEFADWKEENEYNEELHDLFFESTQEIYDYWINNVYGL